MDTAFLFLKVMSLGRHGLKELLLVAGNIFRKFYVLDCFSTSSWQIFRSSGKPSCLDFSIASKERNVNKENLLKNEPETRIIRHGLAWHRHTKYGGLCVNL